MNSKKWVKAYIGLGSNLDAPLEHVSAAIQELNTQPEIEVRQCSSWYGSKAIGPGVQADYVNGAAELATRLSAHSLLDILQAIEDLHGRIRTARWGARTLDLDLLWFDQQNIDHPRLQLPHPRISERNFVVFPLQEIAPRLILSDSKTISILADELGDEGIWKL